MRAMGHKPAGAKAPGSNNMWTSQKGVRIMRCETLQQAARSLPAPTPNLDLAIFFSFTTGGILNIPQ
ncbi:hypothetical protein SAMN04487766_106183 [Actinomyces ruminicola]|uniref:Uncharacterized protein n=1 Tax=Actinomyces ruminicola TaxID=332524 RepID=A0A1G9VXJ1_9ACTO|nr:hypothetical protein SAMN04487766_106183 [Actinomyces ruminicola]